MTIDHLVISGLDARAQRAFIAHLRENLAIELAGIQSGFEAKKIDRLSVPARGKAMPTSRRPASLAADMARRIARGIAK